MAAPAAAMEDADALRLHAALMSGPPCVRAALGVLRDALRLYGDHRVVVSFNGGKDATVVAHLLRAALAAHRREGRVDQQAAQGAGASAAARQQQRPLAVYWEEPLMFPELDAFVKGTAARYGLELIVYTGGFVEGLADLVAKRPGCALVMGTRSTDPNGINATAFEPSSPNWPTFMRVNPILGWSYKDVWDFLRGNGLPYCSLYDLGFTSLGNRSNTVPNPALALEGGGYAPAFALEDGSKERWSRVPKAKAAKQAAAVQGHACAAQGSGSGSGPEAEDSSAGSLPGPPLASVSTVGVVVVGDEILRGDVADANSPLVAKICKEAGAALVRVAVVRDDLDEIADEVRRQAERCELVFTSGGVGPTHDDVSLEAVARAFRRPLTRHKGMVEALRRLYKGKPLNEAQLKMADVPTGAHVEFLDEVGYPLVRCGNVVVLPGVPAFFRKKATVVLGRYLRQRPLARATLIVFCEESVIAGAITKAAASAPHAAVGSYPEFGNPGGERPLTRVTIESADERDISQVTSALIAALPAGVKHEQV